MFRSIMRTRYDAAITLARLVLGIVFFAHGAQKVLGWFGGYGFEGTMGFFTQRMHIPAFLAVCAILAEFLGGIGLIFGFLTRIAAFGIAVNMVVAVLLIHIHNGFFMNWNGGPGGEGFEFHLLALALCGFLMWRGAGAYSIDFMLTHRYYMDTQLPQSPVGPEVQRGRVA